MFHLCHTPSLKRLPVFIEICIIKRETFIIGLHLLVLQLSKIMFIDEVIENIRSFNELSSHIILIPIPGRVIYKFWIV